MFQTAQGGAYTASPDLLGRSGVESNPQFVKVCVHTSSAYVPVDGQLSTKYGATLWRYRNCIIIIIIIIIKYQRAGNFVQQI